MYVSFLFTFVLLSIVFILESVLTAQLFEPMVFYKNQFSESGCLPCCLLVTQQGTFCGLESQPWSSFVLSFLPFLFERAMLFNRMNVWSHFLGPVLQK